MKLVTTYNSVVGAILSQKRKESGVSQEELSKAIGIGGNTMSKIENGETCLSLGRLTEIAAVLGCGTLGQILTEVDTSVTKLQSSGAMVVYGEIVPKEIPEYLEGILDSSYIVIDRKQILAMLP